MSIYSTPLTRRLFKTQEEKPQYASKKKDLESNRKSFGEKSEIKIGCSKHTDQKL